MLTREEIQGQWNQIKGQIRERWGQITDDELQKAQGNTEQLYGLLQTKTGQTRDQIEQFMNSAIANGQSTFRRAADTAREYANTVGEVASEKYQQVEQQVEDGFSEAQNAIRQRPMESLSAAFGAGVIAGVVLSLVMRTGRA